MVQGFRLCRFLLCVGWQYGPAASKQCVAYRTKPTCLSVCIPMPTRPDVQLMSVVSIGFLLTVLFSLLAWRLTFVSAYLQASFSESISAGSSSRPLDGALRSNIAGKILLSLFLPPIQTFYRAVQTDELRCQPVIVGQPVHCFEFSPPLESAFTGNSELDQVCSELSSSLQNITLDDFAFLKVLGKGSFGKVSCNPSIHHTYPSHFCRHHRRDFVIVIA